jgi:uncharacterized Zn finger protein
MGIGIPRSVACDHCGAVHDLVVREDTRGVRCGSCGSVFWLDDRR